MSTLWSVFRVGATIRCPKKILTLALLVLRG